MREPVAFLDGRVTLYPGDCREVLCTLPENSMDSCCCDPPYALVSIRKRFGKPGSAPAQHGRDGLYARASAGFMGKQWDTGETAHTVEFWAEVLRVLKPGGHLVAFAGTRTYHRMASAIEDAGFEIRDQIAWTYGSGFPKSHNAGNGRGTALKPAWEPICLARKPLTGTVAANVLEHGTGALNIDGCRVAATDGDYEHPGNDLEHTRRGAKDWRMPMQQAKPNALGRWPANLVHDGSDEVVACFPDAKTGGSGGVRDNGGGYMQKSNRIVPNNPMGGDSGSAARFFYQAKADHSDRLGSKHPTIKPVDLMQWLVRMVTPPGGTVLDPFAGTGTTGEAAWREGFNAILIEREEEYQADIAERMRLAVAGPEERRRELIKRRGLADDNAGPLFDLSQPEAAE